MVVMLYMLASVVMGQESLQDESFLLQVRNGKIGVGYHNELADPVDVCKDSDGVSIKQLDPRMKEDCTHKDFHIWHTKIKQAPTYEPGQYAKDDAWRTVKVQEEDGWQSSCVAFVQTNKTSCTDWCGVHGLKCVKAMDNAGDQESHLRPWFEAEDYMVSQCSLGAHAEAFKGQKIEGYVDTHGCDLPLNSQICACQTTTTTTVANPPMLDDYDCTTAKNFVSGKYSQISLTDYCPKCFDNPKYNHTMGQTYDSHSTAHVEALANALDYCKEECNTRNCSAFFFQKHGNGHEICAFYMEAVNLKDAVKHGHQECSQICTRKKFILGEHQARTRRPTCPENSSPVTSADTCKQSATSLDMNLDFNGIVSRPNFAPGCYHLDAPDHPLSSGIFFNDAGGDWHANTGFRGAVALVCSSDNSMTYELGAPRRKPAMETAPTCPTNTASLSDESKCADYAKMAGKSFNTADLPNYPRGCSDRIDHPQFAGVWWNSAKGGTWDQQEGTWWNQHPGFTGEVALVCEPTMPHLTTCDDHLAQALTAYWEYGDCGYWGNDYNQGLCGGLLSGDCPEFWDKPENSDYIIFSEAEKMWEGISAEIKCVRAQLKSFVTSTAFTQERIFTSDGKGNRKGNIGEAVSWSGAKCNGNCHYLWHAQYECVETATTTPAPAVQLQYHVSPGPGLCLSLGKSNGGAAGCDGGGCSGHESSDATLQPCSAPDLFQSFTYSGSDRLLRSESGSKDQCLYVGTSGVHSECEPFSLRGCDASDAQQHFTKESAGGATVWRNEATALAIDVNSWANSKDNWVWACPGTNTAKYFDSI